MLPDVRIYHKSQVFSLHGSVLMSVSQFWRRILEQSELDGGDDFVEIILDDSTEDVDSYDLIFKLIYTGTVSVKKEEREKIMGKLEFKLQYLLEAFKHEHLGVLNICHPAPIDHQWEILTRNLPGFIGRSSLRVGGIVRFFKPTYRNRGPEEIRLYSFWICPEKVSLQCQLGPLLISRIK